MLYMFKKDTVSVSVYVQGTYSQEVFDSDAEEDAFGTLHPLFRTIFLRR